MTSWGGGGLVVAPVSSPRPAAGPHPGLGREEWPSQGRKHGWDPSEAGCGQVGPRLLGGGQVHPCLFPWVSLCTRKDFGIHRSRGPWGSEPAECEELVLVNSNIWYLLGVPSRKMPPGSSGSWLLEPREKMLHGPLTKGRRRSAGGGESGVSWPAAPPAWGGGGAGTGTWEQG